MIDRLFELMHRLAAMVALIVLGFICYLFGRFAIRTMYRAGMFLIALAIAAFIIREIKEEINGKRKS